MSDLLTEQTETVETTSEQTEQPVQVKPKHPGGRPKLPEELKCKVLLVTFSPGDMTRLQYLKKIWCMKTIQKVVYRLVEEGMAKYNIK